MPKNRIRQNKNRAMKKAEERIEKRTGTWNDPTPYLAIKNIIQKEKQKQR